MDQHLTSSQNSSNTNVVRSAYQLELEIISKEDSGYKVPLIINDTDFKIQKLEKRVFTFDSSEGDKLHFKKQLFKYLYSPEDEYIGFHKFLWEMIWKRNDEGKYCKYMYFNEKSQRLYIDRDFLSWCKLITDIMSQHLDNWGVSKS